jgi:hypothetical protein
MTGMELKVKKVIRKGSSIRYFVNNLGSLSDVGALLIIEEIVPWGFHLL